MRTYVVVAAVHTQLRRQGDRGAEPEDDQEKVEDEWQERHYRPFLLERCREEEEQGEHGEGRAEHGVVVDCRVCAHGDGVSDEGHDQEGHEELEAPQSKIDDFHFGGVGPGLGRMLLDVRLSSTGAANPCSGSIALCDGVRCGVEKKHCTGAEQGLRQLLYMIEIAATSSAAGASESKNHSTRLQNGSSCCVDVYASKKIAWARGLFGYITSS